MVAVNDFFSLLFFKLGYSIGKYPKVNIVVPVVVSIALFSGVYTFKFEKNIKYLFTPQNGLAQQDGELIEKYFPMDYSEKFTPSRMPNLGRFTRVIITNKDEGGSILKSGIWSEIMEVDQLVRNISIGDLNYDYSQLCASWNGECYKNTHLGLGSIIDKVVNGSLRLSYPVMFNPVNFESYEMNLFFGGITLENGSTTIESIKAIDLIYFVKSGNAEEDIIGEKWESAVADRLVELENSWRSINVYHASTESYTAELHDNMFSVFPNFFLSSALMMVFVIITSYTGDWVTSKPLVVCLGIISASLGTAACVGFLCYIGIELIGINMAILFIALGVGMDDTFVVVAAWWKTSPTDSVPQRMAECYSDAAVSITVTTLTDALSFYVGVLSSAPSIRIFCIYAGTAVLFIYIWHIFFFGGILALSGYYEEENRHSVLFWRKVIPKSESGRLSVFSRWFLTGGNTSAAQEKPKDNVMMEFFKESFAPLLEKTFVKIIVLFVYLGYIMISAWGVSQLQEGLRMANLVNDNSFLHDYYIKSDEYFRKYPIRMQVTVTTQLDYSVKENQEKVLNAIKNLANTKYTTLEYEENWLISFLRFVENYGEFYELHITKEEDFIDTLRTHFLTNTSYYTEDVKFNENFTKIIATRYIIQVIDVLDAIDERNLFVEAIKIAKETPDLEVTVFHPFFPFYEMTDGLKRMTQMLVSIAAVLVLIVFIAFNPSLASSSIVFLSIVSIELGVLGFTVLWDINLDIISTITLIMCIGFSVDFPAHVSYAYISSKYDTPEERVRDTLHSLGLPILQGATSTLIALCGLFYVKSYIYQIFFKIISLVMVFSAFHGLFILPVLLLIFKPDPHPIFSRTKTFVLNESSHSDEPGKFTKYDTSTKIF